MLPKWKSLAATVVAAGVLASATACAASSSNDESESTLTLSVSQQPASLVAANAGWGNEAPYLQAVYDTILRATPDGDIVEGLAEDWSYNDDNTVLTLTIRDGVTFSDGTPLDADAVAQNIERFRTGASPARSWSSDIAAVSAPDESTVEITLEQANPVMLTYLTMSPGLVESPAVFDSADIETNPVGSGPYILNVDESVTGSNYVYTRNPDYWDPESVHYDNLVIRVLTDPTAVLNAVRAGEIDGGNLLDNAAIGDVEAVGYTVNPLELDWEGLLLLDRDGALAPELADVRVRQAINYAFDREGLLKAFSDGNGTVTTQIFPPTSVGYDTALDEAYSYDPEKARELLSEAGYPDGFTLEMPSVTSYSAANWALIAQQLSEVGITVNYTDATTTFIADVLGTKYPVTWLRLQQDQDWGLIRFELTPDAIFNPFHTTDPQLSALIEQVRTTTGAENEEAVSAVNEFVVDQAWFAPWFRPQTSFVTKPGTTVQVQTGNAYPYLWNIKPE